MKKKIKMLPAIKAAFLPLFYLLGLGLMGCNSPESREQDNELLHHEEGMHDEGMMHDEHMMDEAIPPEEMHEEGRRMHGDTLHDDMMDEDGRRMHEDTVRHNNSRREGI